MEKVFIHVKPETCADTSGLFPAHGSVTGATVPFAHVIKCNYVIQQKRTKGTIVKVRPCVSV